MLRTPEPPDLDGLRAAVSPALADYRVRHGTSSATAFSQPLPIVTHVLQRWLIPRGSALADAPLAEVLDHGGRWHLQIELGGVPTYCARAGYGKAKWRLEWFGEAWLARAVEAGIVWLNGREDALKNAEVRLVSSRLYRFTSFWLHPGNRHLVVSARDRGRVFLPLMELLDQEELRTLLLEHFGLQHGARGIGDVSRAARRSWEMAAEGASEAEAEEASAERASEVEAEGA